jgi:hypothetical protein
MTTEICQNGQRGIMLAERLGLGLPKREGHDLAGPCIACDSSDAFRLHVNLGVAQCYSCGGEWSPFQIAEAVFKDREQAKALMVELGIFEASANDKRRSLADPIELIARQKGITRQSLLMYGAEVKSRDTIELPAYDADGIQCTTFRMSTDGDKGLFAKGKRAGLFFPHVDGEARLPQSGESWHLVEGPKDAAALKGLELLACGLNTCQLNAKFARLFQGVDVILVPDRDRAGEEGAKYTARVLHGVAASVRIATLPAEFKESNGADVRDILRLPDGRRQVLWAIGNSRPAEMDGDRPEIEVTPDEHRVNDQAVAALVSDSSLFQRAGILVHILHDHSSKTLRGITRPANMPRVAPLREVTLRERLSSVARFVVVKHRSKSVDVVQVHPPAFCTNAVAARGHWPGMRHLEGVISSPILRRDGTVLQSPGYDPETGLYYEPMGSSIRVPRFPTLEDAHAACEAILEVVVDFPFSSAAHRSAWLAFLLTPLARHAFEGPSPLFLIDANIRASGKSLLADAASLIVTGRDIARMACPKDDNEMRKRITALTLGGDQMVLVDNIAGEFGNASLDAALTGTVWKDRILGRSEIVEMPLLTVWAATGNNVLLLADTSRRVCHIRLHSPLENPEERQDFTHVNLKRWVRRNRPQLLADALTILAAYCRAGRPDQELKTWGSFEGWSDLVRQAVVWAGLPDPGETRQELASSADRDAAALRALLLGWQELDPDGTGLSASKLIDRLEKHPDSCETVRSAILELCPAPAGKLPGARSLGSKLGHLRGRVVAGRCIDRRDQQGTSVWFVVESDSDDAAKAGLGGSLGSLGSFSCPFADRDEVVPGAELDLGNRNQCEKDPKDPKDPPVQWEEGEL